MKLLIRRGKRAIASLPRPIFTLRVRAELLEEEESLLEQYKVGNALLYEGNRKEQIETAFGIAVTSFIASAALLYLIGFRVWAAVMFGLVLAAFAFRFTYQRIREEIYLDDILEGRTFLCRSVVELMEREQLIENICLDVRQLLEDMKSWEGEEVVEVVPTHSQP